MTAYLLGLSVHEYSNFHSAMLFMSNCSMMLLLTRYCVHTEFRDACGCVQLFRIARLALHLSGCCWKMILLSSMGIMVYVGRQF